jgi:hypothetical protein
MMEQFGAFTASELYCPKCRQARRVRERLLLVLPSGELYEYLCTACGESLGKRTVTARPGTARPTASTRRRPEPRRLLR